MHTVCRPTRAWAFLLALCTVACNKAGPPDVPPDGDDGVVVGTEVAVGTVPACCAGNWSSASCGTRAYERQISFAEDGSFRGRDLVAACPPGARCVWSGIVSFTGNWTREGDRIALAVAPTGGMTSPEPVPDHLLVDPAADVPAEEGPSGPCPFERRAEEAGAPPGKR